MNPGRDSDVATHSEEERELTLSASLNFVIFFSFLVGAKKFA